MLASRGIAGLTGSLGPQPPLQRAIHRLGWRIVLATAMHRHPQAKSGTLLVFCVVLLVCLWINAGEIADIASKIDEHF